MQLITTNVHGIGLLVLSHLSRNNQADLWWVTGSTWSDREACTTVSSSSALSLSGHYSSPRKGAMSPQERWQLTQLCPWASGLAPSPKF